MANVEGQQQRDHKHRLACDTLEGRSSDLCGVGCFLLSPSFLGFRLLWGIRYAGDGEFWHLLQAADTGWNPALREVDMPQGTEVPGPLASVA